MLFYDNNFYNFFGKRIRHKNGFAVYGGNTRTAENGLSDCNGK